MTKKNQPSSNSLARPENYEPDEHLLAEIRKRISGTVGTKGAAVDAASVQIAQLIKSETFSGPFPHPRHLEEYERILPGAAERIFVMTEVNLNHQQEMDKEVLKAARGDALQGRVFGSLALLISIGAAIWAGSNDQVVLAGMFLGAAVMGVVVTLITGSRRTDISE